MKEHILHFFMLCTFIIFMYASVMQGTVYGQEKLKFSTQQTRELWQVCATSFRNINPGIGQDIYFPTCDCYVDHIRANYNQKMMDNMTSEGSNILSQELRNACNPKNQPEENFTKWEYQLKTFPTKS